MTRNWAWALLLVVAPLMGCNQGSQGDTNRSSPVGVVDLDRTASELGLTQQVTQILKEEDQRLVAGLMDIKQKMQTQFDAKKKQAGETPSTKDKEELQLMEIQANQILENMRQRSQMRLQEVRAALVQQLRLKFSESIQGVAKTHQMKVVLTSPNDAVIYSAAAVDITGDLIESLRDKSSSIKLSAPALPPAPAGTTAPPATSGNPPPKTSGSPAPAPAPAPAPTPPAFQPPAATTTGPGK